MTDWELNPKNIPLSPSIIELFDVISRSMGEIIIDTELKPNSGDSHIFVILINNNNREDYFVVKIASDWLIHKEWDAYQQYLPKKLRGITEIIGPPVILTSHNIGALIYPLIGNKEFKVESLLDYCKNTELKNIMHDILEDEFFENLQFLWGRGKLQSQYIFREHYSHLLPYYLVIEENAKPIDVDPRNIDMSNLGMSNIVGTTFDQGEYVKIVNGRVSSRYPDENSITIKPIDNDLGSRILCKLVQDISQYQVDDQISHPLIGVVKKTRYELLIENAKVLFPQSVDFTHPSIQDSVGHFYVK